jgi:hypothetical protein
MENTANVAAPDITKVVKDILASIDREREREIIARRFGLYDRKETLEQIGELLGITRERVRQLEKAIMTRLIASAEEDMPDVSKLEKAIIRNLYDLGHVARINDLTPYIAATNTERDRAHLAFIATLAPRLVVVEDNDQYYHSVGAKENHDATEIKKYVDEIVAAIKKNNEPLTIEALHDKLNYDHPDHVRALASISKDLANLQGSWGLTKWPTVNPKNIRDKIYVILRDNGQPMHFNDIADAIKQSDFKRKNVTTQAIHNELIKDSRFVLVGRGIYALSAWGFKKGTVADIISDILKREGGPLHRDEIVKRVLKHRQVKQTTILLNLQGKQRFKRVAKATYGLIS